MSIESFLVISNAVIVTFFYCYNYEQYAVKLDFSFLSFSVVFPLTFLINTTFGRRDQALQKLADFRGCVLSTALFTYTVDWPDPEVPGSYTGSGCPHRSTRQFWKTFVVCSNSSTSI